MEKEKIIGKRISNVKFDKENDRIIFNFSDGDQYSISDEGQYYCEYRYMVCEDNLSYYSDTILKDILVTDCDEKKEADFEYTDIQFLEIITDKGSFQFSTRNEHNGYYGGFEIEIKKIN